ncbi:L,D-transpeptidase [Sphingomonas qomolangmaensis]|uniref:L,D-transpeptidase n=1 Tax=Sphingomonas qomolangmaensis TaxID=2918765 RepID=A0ABY5LCV8_9SPHN|nr:L,D-transpeptidase [Sphingomonas qomolangmaensis]UUL83549.1 L,D-transpeptidase [Sphingomonas qomolangmaensis]
MRRAAIAVVLATAIASPLVAARADPGGEPARRADFKVELPSDKARTLADWVVASRDHQNLPFAIIDKTAARVFVFARDGSVTGAAAALLGSAVGDDSAPGIGQRRLTAILPHERTTPAGRYQAALGHDLDQDILWIDYDKALSLHRVIDGKAKDRRRQRLASPTAADNRISYGCINVPEAFYDGVVAPAFAGTVGIVYILPETRDLAEVFPAMRAVPQR